jgi:Signal peptide binding domain
MGRKWNFEVFLQRLLAFKSMGPLENLERQIPSLAALIKKSHFDWEELDTIERILRAMTLEERLDPDLLSGDEGAARRERIASTSGTALDEVEGLIWQFRKLGQILETTPIKLLTPGALEKLCEHIEAALEGGDEPWSMQIPHFDLPSFEVDEEPELALPEPDPEEVLKAELDGVLRRIGEVGMDGLSDAERAVLDRASAHYRDRQRA